MGILGSCQSHSSQRHRVPVRSADSVTLVPRSDGHVSTNSVVGTFAKRPKVSLGRQQWWWSDAPQRLVLRVVVCTQFAPASVHECSHRRICRKHNNISNIVSICSIAAPCEKCCSHGADCQWGCMWCLDATPKACPAGWCLHPACPMQVSLHPSGPLGSVGSARAHVLRVPFVDCISCTPVSSIAEELLSSHARHSG